MEKIECGMYARTRNGLISKIEEIRDWVIFIEDSDLPFRDKELKASYNIIDLIEVGDYVNGYKVIRLFDPMFLSMGELPYIITNKSKYEPQEIENVVTKEQFESMSYKVGE